ncbi:MAG: cobalamin-binding protein [Nitrospirae bacterium]|nr:cobalamin-binding protein [Nitrospirota bacterium]
MSIMKLVSAPVHIRRLSIFILLVAYLLLFSGSYICAETFTDGTGRKIELSKRPERIVSLAPNITEILFSLKLGDKIAGVTDLCDYPEEARDKPKVGWLISPNIENIISMRPDIVFATTEGNKPEIVDELERMNIKTYVLNPHNINDVINDISAIGDVTGQRKEAREITASLTRRIDSIKKKASIGKPKRVIYLISTDPVISAGPGSFIHDIILTAGGFNVLSDSPIRYPRIDMEELILKDPEVIIVPVDLIGQLQGWKKRWGGISAIKNGMVYTIDPDIVSRPGPRIIDGLEQVHEYIRNNPDINNKAGIKKKPLQ